MSMTTHEWVNNGKFNVYSYTGDVRGKLLASSVITNGLSSVSMSSDDAGMNRFYLEFITGNSGTYHTIQDINVITNTETLNLEFLKTSKRVKHCQSLSEDCNHIIMYM